MVIVRVKVGVLRNMFVLSLQKFSVFWLVWLTINVRIVLVYVLVYFRIFFVVVSLLHIRDLWLLLVYSSIVNTGIIVIRVFGSNYFFVLCLYLLIILGILYLVKEMDSYMEILLVVFFFLVIPPFILFFIKFYVIFRLDILMKVGFFMVIFDVLVLFYYFRLVFMKFILMEVGVLIYIINVFLIFLMLIAKLGLFPFFY